MSLDTGEAVSKLGSETASFYLGKITYRFTQGQMLIICHNLFKRGNE
jgi:hypothetical protein